MSTTKVVEIEWPEGATPLQRIRVLNKLEELLDAWSQTSGIIYPGIKVTISEQDSSSDSSLSYTDIVGNLP